MFYARPRPRPYSGPPPDSAEAVLGLSIRQQWKREEDALAAFEDPAFHDLAPMKRERSEVLLDRMFEDDARGDFDLEGRAW